MHGYNVFFPIGFDAFGLPAENAAIKNGGHPFTWTMQNIEKMRRQLRTMGATFDWKHEVVTADPSYYRWNQWLFLRFLEKGLAYRKLVAGRLVSERRDAGARAGRGRRPPLLAVRRPGREARPRAVVSADDRLRRRAARLQPDRLARADPHPADELDRPVGGRRDRLRDGAVRRTIPSGESLRVFTTRPDTLFGATFMVLAPSTRWSRADGARTSAPRSTRTSSRPAAEPRSTGCRRTARRPGRDRRRRRSTRSTASASRSTSPTTCCPATGPGAIMAVPAHDERDFAFARQFGLPIRRVVAASGHRSRRRR